MNIDVGSLKDFLDFGGTFILALIFLYIYDKRMGSMDDKLTRILALISILTRAQTNFNGIEGVLEKHSGAVANVILEAEKSHEK